MPKGHAEAFLVSCLVMFLRGIRHLPKGVKSRQTRRNPPHISPGTLDSGSLQLLIQERGINQSISPGMLKGSDDTLHANTQPSA